MGGKFQCEDDVSLVANHCNAAIVDAIGADAVDHPIIIPDDHPKRMTIEWIDRNGVKIRRNQVVKVRWERTVIQPEPCHCHGGLGTRILSFAYRHCRKGA